MATSGPEDIYMEPVSSSQLAQVHNNGYHGSQDLGRNDRPKHTFKAAGRAVMAARTMKKSVAGSVADFFGVGENPEEQQKWRNRSINFCRSTSVGGKVKHGMPYAGTMDSVFLDSSIGGSVPPTPTPTSARAPFQQVYDPLHRPCATRQDSHASQYPAYNRQFSRISTASSSKRSLRTQPSRRYRKDSVAKMAFDGIKTLITSPTQAPKRKPYMHSRSFTPGSISSCAEEVDTIKAYASLPYLRATSKDSSKSSSSLYWRHAKSQESSAATSPVPYLRACSTESGACLDDTYMQACSGELGTCSAESGVSLPPFSGSSGESAISVYIHFTYDSSGSNPASYVRAISNESSGSSCSCNRAATCTFTRSPVADSVFGDDYVDDVFFDTATPTSPYATPQPAGVQPPLFPEDLAPLPTITEGVGGHVDVVDGRPPPLKLNGSRGFFKNLPPVPPADEFPTLAGRPMKSGWQVGRSPPTAAPEFKTVDTSDSPFKGLKRIAGTVIDKALESSDRREIGKGLAGKLFHRTYRTDRMNSQVKAQLEEVDEHRPYFTYWITFVQILIYIISVSVYGIAPIGFEETEIHAEVLTERVAIESVSRFEKDNFWIGPRQADLIHLGAKYSPCMRRDENVVEAIHMDHQIENNTACCIRNDGSGCVQSTRSRCSETLSTWFRWDGDKDMHKGRYSGSVCGQDPRWCLNPASTAPFVWLDDITKWPICASKSNSTKNEVNKHMNCEVVGRPCCVGIQGECIMTTREHCQFQRGYFHEGASLCSQVSCMNQICGMIPFLNPELPDQFYRLWTSLFLHAGLLQLAITVIFQFLFMRDLEKLAGWFRICVIYLGSGIAGSLASAVFLPYHVEAGPAGSQFGLLACLFVEVIQNWYILERPFRSVAKLAAVLLALFVIGLLPMVDNYAHLIGFVVGFMLSFALLPYVTFGQYDRTRKVIGIIICLLTAVGMIVLMFILFYVSPVYNCPYCHYFNCIPFTPKFCKTMEVKIGRDYT